MKANYYLVSIASLVVCLVAGIYYFSYENNSWMIRDGVTTGIKSGAVATISKLMHEEDSALDNYVAPKKVSNEVAVASKNEKNQPTDDFFRAIESGQTVVTVTPTKEQNETFEQLKVQMEDHFFIQNLTIQQLIEMEEMQSLPVALQYVIVSKAMTKYNNGEINKENFMSQR